MTDAVKTFEQFHDGFVDGVCAGNGRGGRVNIYLRTADNHKFTLTFDGVDALNVTGFRAGNIIFDVTLLDHSEVTPQDLEELYELPDGEAGLQMRSRLLEKVSANELSLLRIDPSYGAACVALGKSFTLVEAPSLSPKAGEEDGAPGS